MADNRKKRKADTEPQELQAVDETASLSDGPSAKETLRHLIQANRNDPDFAAMLRNEFAKAEVVSTCLQTLAALQYIITNNV